MSFKNVQDIGSFYSVMLKVNIYSFNLVMVYHLPKMITKKELFKDAFICRWCKLVRSSVRL